MLFNILGNLNILNYSRLFVHPGTLIPVLTVCFIKVVGFSKEHEETVGREGDGHRGPFVGTRNK